MSAQLIFDLAPLGATVSYSDGTPRPPERFRKKLAAWENRNSGGRLIRKVPARTAGSAVLAACITLHEGDYGGQGVVVLTVHRSFSVFVVTQCPAIGSVRILSRAGEDGELLHLADNRAAAEAWLTSHRYPGAIQDAVTADEVAASAVEGRAAA
ncbi:MAG: hypothetical protein JWQ22_2639 [Devosia sp.]|nr:hypothetical protein [Devosia sp.]